MLWKRMTKQQYWEWEKSTCIKVPEKIDIANNELYKYILSLSTQFNKTNSNALEPHKWNLLNEICLLGFFLWPKSFVYYRIFYHFIIYLACFVRCFFRLSVCWQNTIILLCVYIVKVDAWRTIVGNDFG